MEPMLLSLWDYTRCQIWLSTMTTEQCSCKLMSEIYKFWRQSHRIMYGCIDFKPFDSDDTRRKKIPFLRYPATPRPSIHQQLLPIIIDNPIKIRISSLIRNPKTISQVEIDRERRWSYGGAMEAAAAGPLQGLSLRGSRQAVACGVGGSVVERRRLKEEGDWRRSWYVSPPRQWVEGAKQLRYFELYENTRVCKWVQKHQRRIKWHNSKK